MFKRNESEQQTARKEGMRAKKTEIKSNGSISKAARETIKSKQIKQPHTRTHVQGERENEEKYL